LAALTGKHIRLRIDNTIAGLVVNNRMMEYVCDIFWLSAHHNSRLTSTYIMPPRKIPWLNRCLAAIYRVFKFFWPIGNRATICSSDPDFFPFQIQDRRIDLPLPALMDKMAKYVTSWLPSFSQRTYYCAHVMYYLTFCSTYEFG
jgi:hypothetical protein